MLLVRNKLNLFIATDISFEVTNMKYDLEHMQTCYMYAAGRDFEGTITDIFGCKFKIGISVKCFLSMKLFPEVNR